MNTTPQDPATPPPGTPALQPGEPISPSAQQIAHRTVIRCFTEESLARGIQRAIQQARAADARRIAELERERDEWRCSAKLYHSELRDLAAGKKVETNLAFPVEQIITTLRTALADALAQVKSAAADTERLAITPPAFAFFKYDPLRSINRWTLLIGVERIGDFPSFCAAIDAARAIPSPGFSVDGTTKEGT